MRRLLSIAGLLAIASIANGTTQLETPVVNALTPIDSVPTESMLTQLWGDRTNALSKLTMIAGDATIQIEYTGVRLRAIHALAKYCPLPGQPGSPSCSASDAGWPAHEALVAIATNQPLQIHAGRDLLFLRAAIESLGTLHVASDVSTLAPLLEHSSRDIRAATARALRDLCNAQAGDALRARQGHETSDQVRLAISDALRVLANCP
jgi:hypothetical protein